MYVQTDHYYMQYHYKIFFKYDHTTGNYSNKAIQKYSKEDQTGASIFVASLTAVLPSQKVEKRVGMNEHGSERVRVLVLQQRAQPSLKSNSSLRYDSG